MRGPHRAPAVAARQIEETIARYRGGSGGGAEGGASHDKEAHRCPATPTR
jgi:hypothetical protein